MTLIAKASAGLLVFFLLLITGLNDCTAGYAITPSGLFHEEMIDSRILSIKKGVKKGVKSALDLFALKRYWA